MTHKISSDSNNLLLFKNKACEVSETMGEEVLEVPKWLKELEEKREKRLKVKLGHEAGAGSPCLTCEDQCPGLDLHFWRKICKNCKCGKESHDVNDDDIYGWAQFHLLGSKPNKAKKIVLPGCKDAVELEWTPKGQLDVVESYLKDLPVNLLPIKGSPAAQERKQLLHKQIPLHDIDPSLCHALSDTEVKKMNEYIAHIKQSSVGMGHIIKLNELLKKRYGFAQKSGLENLKEHKLFNIREDTQNPFNANNINDICYDNLKSELVGNKRIPNLQPKNLQLSTEDYQNLTNVGGIRDINYPLHYDPKNLQLSTEDYQNLTNVGGIRDINYPLNYEPKNLQLSAEDYQNLTNVGGIRDINYPLNYEPKNLQLSTEDYQNLANVGGIRDINYPLHYDPKNLQLSTEDYQNLTNVGGIRDINYPLHYNESMEKCNEELKNLQVLPNYVNKILTQENSVQLPTDCGHIRDIYRDSNVNYNCTQTSDPNLDTFSNLRNANLPQHDVEKLNSYTDEQQPQKFGNIRDLAYSTYDPKTKNVFVQSHLNPKEQNVNPEAVKVGLIKDIEYPGLKAAVHYKDDIPEPNRKTVTFDPYVEEILPSCHKCKKVFDKNAVVIGIDRTDSLWHADCFKCCGCNQNLADLMYFYDKESDNVYCGRDYAKIRGIPRCQACDELIFVKEYCLAENSTFHVKHFCCYECDDPLAGQNYLMEDSQPLCLPCYEKIKAEKCVSCGQLIKPDEQGAKLKDVHFHADDRCFACKSCKKSLLGAKCLFKNNILYCSAACFNADT